MNLDALKGLRPLDDTPDDAAATPAGSAPPAGVLIVAQRTLLAAVQDRLIPRDGDLPGAGESGAADRVDGFLAERPDWRAQLLAALEAVQVAAAKVGELRADGVTTRTFLDLTAAEQDATLQGVEAAEPRLFARLLRMTYSAYYTDPDVLRQAGFEAHAPQPGGYGLEPFDPTRLEPICRRGKLWRDA